MSSVTGAVVTEGNGAQALLGVMLLSSLAALFAALHLLWLDRHGRGHGQPT